MADECRIAGPYLPVGDTDWVCRTHDVEAVPRDPARYGAPDLRKAEMVCPVAANNGDDGEQQHRRATHEEKREVLLRHAYGAEEAERIIARDRIHRFTDEQLRQHDAEVAEIARAEERGHWIRRLAAMCDDDWLRRRDRCMGLHGARSRHDRSPSGAWEHAATILRGLLNEHGYEDDDPSRHDSYLAWVSGGRDRGEQERADAATQEAGPT